MMMIENKKSLRLSIFLIFFLISSCEDENAHVPVEITIISPEYGAVVQNTVSIICETSNSELTEYIQLFINGEATDLMDYSKPFSLIWNTANFENADYIIIVRLITSDQKIVDSDPLILTVNNQTQDSSGLWQNHADLPHSRQEFYPAELNGEIFLVGGISGTSLAIDADYLSSVDIYNPALNVWTNSTPYPEVFHHVVLAKHEQKLYGFGGYDKRWNPKSNTYVYNPDTKIWSEKTPMAMARGESFAVEYGGKIYVIGGRNYLRQELNLIEEYDPINDTWITKKSMPTPRYHHAAVVFDSLIYVVGGRFGEGGVTINVGVVEAYSPASNKWYIKKSMPTKRGALALAAINGKIYALGGEYFENGGGLFSTVEEYDPLEDKWVELPPMPKPVHGTGAVVFDNSIYILGGGTDVALKSSKINQSFTPALP